MGYFYSFLLHIVALAFFSFLPALMPHSNKQNAADIEVSLIDFQEMNRTTTRKTSLSATSFQDTQQYSESRRRHKISNPKLSLLAGKRINDLITHRLQQSNSVNDGVNTWTDAKAYEGDGLTDFNGMSMREIQNIQTLHSFTNGAIWDSQYLQEYGITGQVFVQITLNRNGDLQDQNVRVQAKNRILKVISLRAIRQSIAKMRKENPPPLANQVIRFRFTWTDQTNCQTLAEIRNTHLSFCRKSMAQRKTFSTAEKTTTYLKALKYGFGAGEEIKKYKQQEMRKETQFNPFEQFERDPDWDLGG